MIHEAYKNVFFGLMSILLLVGTIKHSDYISNNLNVSENYYSSIAFGILITCLFANICLGIFSLFILGNLNDFMSKMAVNLIGAYQKIRVLAILMIITTIFYSFSNVICFFKAYALTALEKKMVIVSSTVIIVQILHLLSMYIIHPDLFGLRWRKELKNYNSGNLTRTTYI